MSNDLTGLEGLCLNNFTHFCAIKMVEDCSFGHGGGGRRLLYTEIGIVKM